MMPEILTESFCERCGTRYTFESAAPRKTRRLGQIKTLSRGMKNWVMSDDTSLDEAMAAARSDDEREVTSQQLDAFHSTFNFCMNCRQYTCANCWNPSEGRCLTCAPHLGHDVLPSPFPEGIAAEPPRMEAEAWPEVDFASPGNGNGNGSHGAEDDAWAAVTGGVDDLPEFDATARLAFLSGEAPLAPPPTPPVRPERAHDAEPDAASPEPAAAPLEGVLETGAAAATVSADQPSAPEAAEIPSAAAAAADEAETGEPLPPSVEGRAATGAARTSDLLKRFRPGQNIDAELAAFEAELDRREEAERVMASGESAPPEPVAEAEPVASIEAVAEAQPALEVVAEPEPSVATAAEPERTAPAPQPEPVAASAAPDPEPAAAEPEPAAAEPEPAEPVAPPAAAAEPVRDDRVQQPTWRIYAPDPAAPSGPATPPSAPQWPDRPDQLDSPAMALLAGRRNGNGNADLWAASAREVLGAPPAGAANVAPTSGVQPCSNCGLSLSANARFCRRCGTRQG